MIAYCFVLTLPSGRAKLGQPPISPFGVAKLQLLLRSPESQKIGPELPVRLREITAKTVRQICRLSDTLSEAHQHMVAPNAVSIAEAHFNEYAWFRAIYAGEEPVGFIMLYIGPDDDQPDKTIHFLWRFMIAGPYQGMGFGDKALRIVIEDLKTRGVSELRTSCGLGEGSPESFYLKMGFVPTGRMLGEEKELNLAFQQSNESTSP